MADEQSPDTQPSTPDPGSPEYDASAITVLEGLEAVRKRPGMYIGSTGERGLHHLVWEIVDNAVDEAMAGHADTIDVTLMEDGAVRVKDNGRGIPTDIHEAEGISAVELVLTQLHAGGKFGGGGYKVSGGLHGVGSSVVNALSTRLDVCVRQKGHAHRMSFDHGVPTGPLRREEETDATGTTITYWANPEIFETVEYDYETIRARFQQMAFLNKGLTINLVDERVDEPTETEQAEDLDHVDDDITEVVDSEDGAEAAPKKARKVSYRYDNGIVDYVTHLVGSKKAEPVTNAVIDIETADAMITKTALVLEGDEQARDRALVQASTFGELDDAEPVVAGIEGAQHVQPVAQGGKARALGRHGPPRRDGVGAGRPRTSPAPTSQWRTCQ